MKNGKTVKDKAESDDEPKEVREAAREAWDGLQSGDDPPRSDVIDAALTHLIQSVENVEDARGDINPKTIQRLTNTDVVALHYRTSVNGRWR